MIALLTLLALQSAPLAPAKAPAVKAVAATDDKDVCRSDERTGSRLSTRTCHTNREWRELEFQSSEWLRSTRPLPCTDTSMACR